MPQMAPMSWNIMSLSMCLIIFSIFSLIGTSSFYLNIDPRIKLEMTGKSWLW